MNSVFIAQSQPLEPQQKEDVMQTMTSWEEKGMEKGMEKATQKIALSLLEENISIQTIARTTGLSIAQIHQIQAENQQ
jgi:predicted transposase/invertase (TIGR01784 family)